MSQGHTEDRLEAFERLIRQCEHRQGAPLWSQIRRHLELLLEKDTEVCFWLLRSALAEEVRRPCSWLYLRTNAGTEPQPRPSWDVAGTVRKRVIWHGQARDSSEARMLARRHYEKLGAEFSPSNHGTERSDG